MDYKPPPPPPRLGHFGQWAGNQGGKPVVDYRIVMTERTRHGSAKRHTFVLAPGSRDGATGPQWMRLPDIAKQVRKAHGAGFGGPAKPLNLQRWGLGTQPLPSTVPLGRGVDVPADALTLILDALVTQGRHQVDIAEVKLIVSQLGSRLTALRSLPAEQRHIAEPALYVEILKRCTTLGTSVNDLEPGEKD